MICTMCRWHKNKYINLATYDGDPDADIVFLGEAYGKSEVENYLDTGDYKYFVGKAGFKFSELLELAGLVKYEVAIMNSMRCYQLGSPTPTKHEMDLCFIHTSRDIKKIKPKLIVAMGGAALYQATGKEGISRYLGKLIWSDKLKCKVYCVRHPIPCMYDPDRWDELKEHFEQIPFVIDKDPLSIKHYEYTHIKTKGEFNKFFPILKDSNELFFDIESTGLDPINDELKLLQIGTIDKQIAVIEANLLPSIKDKLEYIFNNKPMTGQDYGFDAKFLYHQLGIMPKIFNHDTCLAEFILTGMKDNNLTYLTGKYVPESFGYDDKISSVGGFHLSKDKTAQLQYASDDVGVLPKIKKSQTRALLKSGQYKLFKDIIVPCNKVLTKMSNRGVYYDLGALKHADNKYKKLAESCLAQVMELDSIKACQEHFKKIFNPKSSQMIKWLILEYYELPVLKETKKKNPSVGKVEMKRYADEYDNEYCNIMELYRSYENIRNNFLSGVIPKLNNGVAHTRYSLHSTTTGRPNSKDPNLLNIPRADKDIKRVYVARPNYLFLYGDLSQIEVRVAAMLSQDYNLMKICNTEGQDFHCTMTAVINGMEYDHVYQQYIKGDSKIIELRNQAKTIVFGILYGMTIYGLAYRLGMSKAKAEKFIDKFFEPFSALKDWINFTTSFVLEYGYVETYFGFRRYFKDFKNADEKVRSKIIREAVNMPVQGTAWNLMQLIMVQLDDKLEGMKSGSNMQVYDSVAIETHESEIEIVAPMMNDVMCNVNKPFERLNTVELRTDIEIGPNLADLKGYII